MASITDFNAGISGDRLLIPTWRLTNFTANNPFASGHARLTQLGAADTLLELDTDGFLDGATFQICAILANVTQTTLVALNFNGFDPVIPPIFGPRTLTL